MTKNFFDPNIFSTQKFFDPKIFFDHKIFLSNFYFEPNLKDKSLILTKILGLHFQLQKESNHNLMGFDTIEINLVIVS